MIKLLSVYLRHKYQKMKQNSIDNLEANRTSTSAIKNTKDCLIPVFQIPCQHLGLNSDTSYELDEDSTLHELKGRISMLKDQRNQLMNVMILERKDLEAMQSQMSKMKKQKCYLEGLFKDKSASARDYDRIISQSEKTLFKLSENTKKLLLSVDNQYGKFFHK